MIHSFASGFLKLLSAKSMYLPVKLLISTHVK